jgi:hypothetical protein
MAPYIPCGGMLNDFLFSVLRAQVISRPLI